MSRLLDRPFAPGAEEHFGQTFACLGVQAGEVVWERYGTDTGPDDQLLSWSIAKSFTHAAAGIAVRDGIVDLDAPVLAPEWSAPDDPRRAITVDDLLTMRPGLTFVEDYVDDSISHCIDMLFGAGMADMAAYAASLPLEHPPGTVHNYASGTTNIVCRMLADRVGRGDAFQDWLRAELLDPLGFGPTRLTFDDAGTWVGSSYLYATARDFARFGELYLRDGVVDGDRLLPEGWVTYAHTPTGADDEGNLYGAHWWINDPDRPVYAARGYETQRIIVVPDQDLVVVRFGKTPVELAPAVDSWLTELIETA